MDNISRYARSEVMRRVKSRNNRSTERRLRAMLVRGRLRGWQVQAKDIVGKPDFVFRHLRIALFIDSCFWHGCAAHLRRPKTNQRYWLEKIERNRRRDRTVNRRLRSQGWSVIRIWEHELPDSARVMGRILYSAHPRSRKM